MWHRIRTWQVTRGHVRPYRPFSLAWGLTAVLAASAFAADRKVPSQYPTIQSAIDAAQPTDRVLVAPGVYRERIRIPARPIAVTSESGAASTTIDGGGPGPNAGPVVTFDPGVNGSVALSGFTIRGGYVEGPQAFGAGILCAGASPLISDNVIVGNRTYGTQKSYGAGLYVTGRAVVLNNEIRDNMAIGFTRGAFFGGAGLYASDGVFVRNRLVENAIVSANSITDRLRDARGGGAYLRGTRTWFVDNEVSGNFGAHFSEIVWGGGLYLEDTPFVALNVIRGNAANANRAFGGGIACAPGSAPIIESNVIIENFAQGAVGRAQGAQGGGIYVDAAAKPVIAYNTIVYNRVSANPGVGGGIASNSAAPVIVGCLLWGNSFWRDGADTAKTTFYGVNGAAVSHCLVGDGQFAGTSGNFSTDPMLRDGYHLANGSPCIDRGEAAAPRVTLPLDADLGARLLDGSARGDTGRIDIGAAEYRVLRRAERIKVRPGDVVPIILDTNLAERTYYLAASLGNTGIPLVPPDPRVLPLSPDALFFVSLARRVPPFQDFSGTTDSTGWATASLTIANDPRMAGVTMYVAGGVLRGTTVGLVTNELVIPIE